MEIHGVWRPHSLLGQRRHHPGERGWQGLPRCSLVPGLGIQEPPRILGEAVPCSPPFPWALSVPQWIAHICLPDHTALLCLQELNCNYFSVTVAALFFKC